MTLMNQRVAYANNIPIEQHLVMSQEPYSVRMKKKKAQEFNLVNTYSKFASGTNKRAILKNQ